MNLVAMLDLPRSIGEAYLAGKFITEPMPETDGPFSLTPTQSLSRFINEGYTVELMRAHDSPGYMALVRKVV